MIELLKNKHKGISMRNSKKLKKAPLLFNIFGFLFYFFAEVSPTFAVPPGACNKLCNKQYEGCLPSCKKNPQCIRNCEQGLNPCLKYCVDVTIENKWDHKIRCYFTILDTPGEYKTLSPGEVSTWVKPSTNVCAQFEECAIQCYYPANLDPSHGYGSAFTFIGDNNKNSYYEVVKAEGETDNLKFVRIFE